MLRSPLRALRHAAALRIRQRVHAALDDHDAPSTVAAVRGRTAPLHSRLLALTTRVEGLHQALSTIEDQVRLATAPFSTDLTIDQILSRHPGAAAVLRRHQLPDCTRCAVRMDETLEEAAEAYDLDADAILVSLQSLLCTRHPHVPAIP